MKFTDGFWQLRPGVHPLYAQEAYSIDARHSDAGDRLVVTAPTKRIEGRGDTLNRPVLTVSLSSPMEGVVTVRVEHHRGRRPELSFDLDGHETGHGSATVVEGVGTLTSGDLSAVVSPGAPWNLRFVSGDRTLTASGSKSLGHITLDREAEVARGIVGDVRVQGADAPAPSTFVHAQLDLGVGELVYGLGERFGPLIKNGQTVDIWNADGGTSSEQAYKNVPFYLTNRGYGILVDHPGHVSFEIGSEAVERVQFSVPGESLVFHVIGGGTPAGVLERYTALTGRPAHVPAWSYGLWLSTSFTTDYDEATVSSFVDQMAAHELPVSVFHFDCFWMREFTWCDFEWDPRVFPDPEGMLQRLHKKDLRVCVWINPYIGQASALFDEAADAGYLVRRADGTVWQWDLWQAGMGLVDFTNPAAKRWYQDKLRALIAQGVDCFKTDFGERIPLGVEYHDGSDPERMHNWYTQLYNEAVFEVLQETRGEGEAVLFARSATVGGQKMPVHWGGDNTSSLPSMAETLRGGLSLALSGFGFWSHDIGGFEGTPDAGVFKRWVQFGLLSSHSRFHGSNSYRVPWAFDDEAVAVTKAFTELKLRLMPYLYAAGLDASARGIPVMRPMILAFPDDPTAAFCDRQYMLGPDLLVAPVFDEAGDVTYYLPLGSWTNWFTGEVTTGGGWRTERHGYDTLPLWVRGGSVLPLSTRTDRPDHNYLESLELRAFPSPEAHDTVTVTVTVTNPSGASAVWTVAISPDGVIAKGAAADGWTLSIAASDEGPAAKAIRGTAVVGRPQPIA